MKKQNEPMIKWSGDEPVSPSEQVEDGDEPVSPSEQGQTEISYNGWANRETWNVALWLQNDWPLYNVTKSYYGHKQPYESLRLGLRDSFNYVRTADNVSLWDDAINIEELDNMIMEMQTE